MLIRPATPNWATFTGPTNRDPAHRSDRERYHAVRRLGGSTQQCCAFALGITGYPKEHGGSEFVRNADANSCSKHRGPSGRTGRSLREHRLLAKNIKARHNPAGARGSNMRTDYSSELRLKFGPRDRSGMAALAMDGNIDRCRPEISTSHKVSHTSYCPHGILHCAFSQNPSSRGRTLYPTHRGSALRAWVEDDAKYLSYWRTQC